MFGVFILREIFPCTGLLLVPRTKYIVSEISLSGQVTIILVEEFFSAKRWLDDLSCVLRRHFQWVEVLQHEVLPSGARAREFGETQKSPVKDKRVRSAHGLPFSHSNIHKTFTANH